MALSIVYPDDDPNVERELHDLRRFLPETSPSSSAGAPQSITMQRSMQQALFLLKTLPNFRSNSQRFAQPGHENEQLQKEARAEGQLERPPYDVTERTLLAGTLSENTRRKIAALNLAPSRAQHAKQDEMPIIDKYSTYSRHLENKGILSLTS